MSEELNEDFAAWQAGVVQSRPPDGCELCGGSRRAVLAGPGPAKPSDRSLVKVIVQALVITILQQVILAAVKKVLGLRW
jgi:hypothetical protein